MNIVNGKSILKIARAFNAAVNNSEGHVLLYGVTGTGKSTVLDYYLTKSRADLHPFESREPTVADFEFNQLFYSSKVAVIDNIDFLRGSSGPLLYLLKTVRKKGCKLIVSTQSEPQDFIRSHFEVYFELERRNSGEGISHKVTLNN